ncbi:hypothetical protein MHU86_22053 [Fragilaria crotonensis]|nr:hypothetical protein MHU86_22053 [Fragilaria crotonensis]
MDEATTDHNHADDLFYSDAEMEIYSTSRVSSSEFPVGTVFPTRRQLIDAMRDKASQLGFFVIDRGYSVLCFETTARDSENERRQKAREELSRENGKIYVPRKVAKSKCGCEFKASFVQREAPHRMNSGSQRCNTCMERVQAFRSNSRQHGGVVDMHQSM